MFHLIVSTIRLCRNVGIRHIKDSNLIYIYNQHKSLYNTDVKAPNDLYQSSTVNRENHSDNDQQIGNSENLSNNSTSISDKVWSTQYPSSLHVPPRAQNILSIFNHNDQRFHESTVHSIQGEINVTDPLKTHAYKSESSNSTVPSCDFNTKVESSYTYSPNISSLDIDSTKKLSTVNINPTTLLSNQDSIKYQKSTKPKIFGGQDTSSGSKPELKEYSSDDKQDITSSDNQNSKEQDNKMRDEILCESMKYVHEKGWSMEAIRAGISACDYSSTIEALFYNGYDLVEYFMRDANAKTIAYMTELSQKDGIHGNQLLIDGLKYRIKLLIPYADIWEEALAQKGLPPNAKRAWKSLLDLANDVWITVGDSSTDIKWYTKRISLATIYRSAEIYMIRDESPDKIETMNFLERHLGDFKATGASGRSVTQSLSDTAQVASGLFTVVRSMTTRR